MAFRDKTTVLREKARGPLGWILGVVGGLALLVGSFFAGVATADISGDQEQASVTEQEVQQEQDTDNQGAEDQDAEDQDADAEDRPHRHHHRGDDGIRGDGEGPENDGDGPADDDASGEQPDPQDGTEQDAPTT